VKRVSSSSGYGRRFAELDAPGGRANAGCGFEDDEEDACWVFFLSLPGLGLTGLKMRSGPTVGLSPSSAGLPMKSSSSEMPRERAMMALGVGASYRRSQKLSALLVGKCRSKSASLRQPVWSDLMFPAQKLAQADEVGFGNSSSFDGCLVGPPTAETRLDEREFQVLWKYGVYGIECALEEGTSRL
jgi:hypothetical protein